MSTQIVTDYRNKLKKKLNMVIPANASEYVRNLWNQFYNFLIEGWEHYLIKDEEIEFYKNRFNSIADEEKPEYLKKFEIKISDLIAQFKEDLNMLRMIEFEKSIEKIKKEYPDFFTPYIEYLAYSLAVGETLDPQIIDELNILENLTPEQLKEIEEAQLAKRIFDIKKDKFRVDRDLQLQEGDRQAGKSLTPGQVAQIVDGPEQNQDIPSPATSIQTLPNKKPTPQFRPSFNQQNILQAPNSRLLNPAPNNSQFPQQPGGPQSNFSPQRPTQQPSKNYNLPQPPKNSQPPIQQSSPQPMNPLRPVPTAKVMNFNSRKAPSGIHKPVRSQQPVNPNQPALNQQPQRNKGLDSLLGG